MKFEDTILLPGSLTLFTPTTLPSLFSAARSEFLASNSYSGKFMREVARVFGQIGSSIYSTGFVWSGYNIEQWKKFCSSAASSADGGACMFSLDASGTYNGEEASIFKGLGLGVPTGKLPYHIWVCSNANTSLLQSTVASIGYTLDLVSDHEEA